MGEKGGSKPPPPPQPGASLVDEYGPWGSSVYTPVERIRIKGAPDQWRYRLDVNLTPEQRRIFEQEQSLNQGLNQLALDQTGRLTDHLGRPVSFKNAPEVDAGRIQPQFTTRGMTDLPGVDDFGAERQRVENALYARERSRLDPQFEQERRRMEARLAAQGVAPGTVASRTALDDYMRSRSDAYAGARQNAIIGGGAEQSRLFGNALAARGQEFGERESMAAFRNAAQQQLFGQQTQNRARSIEEILALRNQPINEIAALLGTGGQVQEPSFRGSGEVANANAQTYAAQMAGWQQQQQRRNAMLGGLFGLGSSIGGGFASGFNWG